MEIEVVGDGQVGDGNKEGGGGGGDGGGVASRGGGEMYLVWENLRVMLPNKGNGPTKRLLDGLNGYAEPGKITAIMGPSGSGKSTLLDALAGRLARNVVMAGNVMLNGKKSRLEYDGAAYVTQENILLGTLTVRETVTYSANLRLPRTKTKEQINESIEETIVEMGLQYCADQLIGNWHLRGISGGEKKRLSIALEILTRPSLLFLDEPSSGLDSAAAFFVVQTLRNIARDGRTVISSIHQPSSEVFALFDNLYLLSSGETVYFGEAKLAVQFFAEAGFPCPTKRNPSDHFLRCINADFDRVAETLIGSQRFSPENFRIGEPSDLFESLTTTKIKAILVKKYRVSNYATRTRSRIEEILAMKQPLIEKKPEEGPNWWKQLLLLTQRSFTNMRRDIGYYWVRLAVYILLSICVGTVFHDVGTSNSAIMARGACAGFISGFMTFMSIGGFPSFIEELKVFYVEKLNGHYGVGVYTISNFLSSFPFLFAMALSTAGIVYPMVKFKSGFWHFLYSLLDLLASIGTVESCMMAIATLVPNFIMGLVVGAGYIGILMLTSGYFRFLPDLPKVIWRYPISYVNFGAWGLQGAYKNDMLGMEFNQLDPGHPKLKGEYILKSMLGVNIDYSKWWDLAAVVAILTSFRFLFFAILKFKERTLPVYRRFQAKRTLHNLRKRASFRKNSPFPSKRHPQPLHSLSSQEGLSSPIQ